MKLSLRPLFEAVRRVVNPTPEERAESQRKEDIRKASANLDLAARGFKLEPLTADEIAQETIAFGGLHGMISPRHSKAVPVNDEDKAIQVQKASAKLLALGVTQENIDGIIADAEDAMKNPRPEYFGF